MYERFLQLLKEHKLTAYQVSKATGIVSSTFTEWKKGTYTPKNDKLIKIADYFNINAEWLMGISEEKYKQIDKIPISKVGIKIPVVGRVQAGIPVEAIEEVIDYEEITADMAKTGEFFGLKIKGNSMEPVFYENDVVIVKKQPDVENGEIAIVLVNGDDATVKKIKKVENGIMLIPTNAIYEPIFFTNEQILNIPVNIIGKVVELRRSF